MTADKTRFVLTVPVETAQRAEKLKKEMYHEKSYAEMYRELISIGIQKIQTKNKLNKKEP